MQGIMKHILVIDVFDFQVERKNVSRLCQNNVILTVNGEFPGPPIIVNEGDNVEIKVTNRANTNTTIHWYVCMYVCTYYLIY